MSWLTGNSPVVHEVNGEPLRFVALRLAQWFKLKALASPLASAFARYFADRSKDTGYLERNLSQTDGGFGTEKIQEAVSKDLASFRIEQAEGALQTLCDALLDEPMALLLAEMIMRSLPDEYSKEEVTRESQAAFVAKIDMGTFVQLLEGVAKANAQSLRPFWEKLFRKAQGAAPDGSAPGTQKPGPRPFSTTAPSGTTSSKPSPDSVSKEDSPSTISST